MTQDIRDVLKLALEALERMYTPNFTMDDSPINNAITAIKEALAQPEQEPVAWWNDTGTHIDLNVSGRGKPLYTHPAPQRTWVGLTAGEILDTLISVDEKTVRLPAMLGQFACAIEAKLKEKNT